MSGERIFITGGKGQLGTALKAVFPGATYVDRDECDITDWPSLTAIDWSRYDTIINAAAFTAVDAAETIEGRVAAWKVNAVAVRHLAEIANKHNLLLVHVSSDYVFDGNQEIHTEDESFSPLGVYAQSKAAGDIAASLAARQYIVRTSWVVGEGKNFVLTMMELAKKSVKPNVVSDQIGRLTFTNELAAGIEFLIAQKATYGVYNLSNDGESAAWSDIAKRVYELVGSNPDDITPVSTEEYYQGKSGIAPRPVHSTLNLDKIKAIGYHPAHWRVTLEEYVRSH